mmetsp:Transcript_11572/g.23051  ORF Transcript_11572/g.23051 Transcript_11572/m.23051 type:complete len:340 (+) Transcript_11572:39-1058(+)
MQGAPVRPALPYGGKRDPHVRRRIVLPLHGHPVPRPRGLRRAGEHPQPGPRIQLPSNAEQPDTEGGPNPPPSPAEPEQVLPLHLLARGGQVRDHADGPGPRGPVERRGRLRRALPAHPRGDGNRHVLHLDRDRRPLRRAPAGALGRAGAQKKIEAASGREQGEAARVRRVRRRTGTERHEARGGGAAEAHHPQREHECAHHDGGARGRARAGGGARLRLRRGRAVHRVPPAGRGRHGAVLREQGGDGRGGIRRRRRALLRGVRSHDPPAGRRRMERRRVPVLHLPGSEDLRLHGRSAAFYARVHHPPRKRGRIPGPVGEIPAQRALRRLPELRPVHPPE